MATRFFGQWLLEKGLIGKDALLEALEVQQQTNLPLGAIAVEKGYLTAANAELINGEQQRTDRKFGEIAIDRGLLTDTQLEEVLQAQRERRVMLGEILVSKGSLRRDQLEQELKAYHEAEQRSEALVHAGLQSVPHGEVVRAFMETTLKLFQRVVHETVKVNAVSQREPVLLNGTRHFAQRIRGDENFFYGLSMPDSLSLTVASKILGSGQAEMNELTVDAVSEYVNIITGNGCVQLSMNSHKVTADPPSEIRSADDFAGVAESLCVDMESGRSPFSVHFLFNG